MEIFQIVNYLTELNKLFYYHCESKVKRKDLAMSGLTDKISGKAKQAAGSASGDDKMKNEGKLEEAKGTLKDKLNDVVDTVTDKIDEAKRTSK